MRNILTKIKIKNEIIKIHFVHNCSLRSFHPAYKDQLSRGFSNCSWTWKSREPTYIHSVQQCKGLEALFQVLKRLHTSIYTSVNCRAFAIKGCTTWGRATWRLLSVALQIPTHYHWRTTLENKKVGHTRRTLSPKARVNQPHQSPISPGRLLNRDIHSLETNDAMIQPRVRKRQESTKIRRDERPRNAYTPFEVSYRWILQ